MMRRGNHQEQDHLRNADSNAAILACSLTTPEEISDEDKFPDLGNFEDELDT